MRILFVVFLFVAIPQGLSAQEAPGIGYPSVAAALKALKAKSGVQIEQHGGWTIVHDQANNAVWSFTPPNHAANPAAVKRAVVERDGTVAIDMQVLCQAAKAACDKLVEEFVQMNEKVGADTRGTTAQAPGKGQVIPTAVQKDRVTATTLKYWDAVDRRQYSEAYRLLSASLKAEISFEKWKVLTENTQSSAGTKIRRDITNVTWYKDPPGVTPGVYAAVDFSGQFSEIDTFCGYIAWKEEADGSFVQVREEKNILEKKVAAQLNQSQLREAREKLGCKAASPQSAEK